MYEKVLVVGVSLGRLTNRRPSYVRVHCYTVDGSYRSWSAFTVSRDRLNAGYLFSDTLTPLIEACSGSFCMLTDLQKHLVEGHEHEAEEIECAFRQASIKLLEELATAPEGSEEEVSAKLGEAVVGHIVRIDWEQRGEYGRLAPHALAILPSKEDGSRTFGGEQLDTWFERYDSYRTGRPMDARTARRARQLGTQLLQMQKEMATETIEEVSPAEEDDGGAYPF